jgi:esterase/lipase superfamily enzyme
MSSFTNPITTLTGETIDLETYNLGNTYFWHAFWYGLGLLWVAYWIRKPMYIPRIIAVDSGKADSLITSIDKKVALGFGVGVIAIVSITMAITNEKYPVTTPLQAGLVRGIKSIEMPVPTVGVKIEDAIYRVPGRAMQMTMTVTNNGDSAIRLGEFNTAGVRFMDAAVAQDESGYPDDLLAEEGLTVSNNSPLAPGQTRTIEVSASDAALDDYRLFDIIYDPDPRLAGLLFFFDANGNRSMVIVDAPLIPSIVTSADAGLVKKMSHSSSALLTNIEVFYGTDRKRTGSTQPDKFYGSDRGTLEFGTCSVSIPQGHKQGILEGPEFVWYKHSLQEKNPLKHIVLLDLSTLPEEDFFSKLNFRIDSSDEKQAFVFIHGYNSTFEDAARRTAQMVYDLGFNGAPIFFSWPSQGKVISPELRYFKFYTTDETNVDWSVSDLNDFLFKLSSKTNASTIHLIAHSMGSRALTTALKEIASERRETTAFKEIVLAAPDIDAEKFKTDILPKIQAADRRITLYASSNDEWLKQSEKFHTY